LESILCDILSRRGAPPSLDVREFIEAVLYLARTGVPWRDLPTCFGNWDAVYNRFRRWEKNGTWAKLWKRLQEPAAIKAKRLFVDSTVIRAHQHAAGNVSATDQQRAVGKSRGGFGTKIHLVVVDELTAIGVVITGGQAGDAPAFERAMCDLDEDTAARMEAEVVVADCAYDSDAIRAGLQDAGYQAVIPSNRRRSKPIPHDPEQYKEREKAERLVSRLKRLRRVATRYEKLGCVFLAMVHVACITSILL
jgi:transposase